VLSITAKQKKKDLDKKKDTSEKMDVDDEKKETDKEKEKDKKEDEVKKEEPIFELIDNPARVMKPQLQVHNYKLTFLVQI